jgi:hypothetical protein
LHHVTSCWMRSTVVNSVTIETKYERLAQQRRNTAAT